MVNSVRAQFVREPEGAGPRFVADGGEEQIQPLRLFKVRPALLHEQQQPLHAKAEADAGARGAAELLDQPVVPAAAADGALRADALGKDLEHGPGIVIQPAHERGGELVAHAHRVQQHKESVHVRAAVVAEKVHDVRRLGDDLAARGRLAVEDAQRVGLIARAARLAQLVIAAGQIGAQRLVIARPAVRAADAVEPHGQALESDGVEHLQHDGDALGVRARRRRAEDLHAELMVLAQATGLRPFIAEHGTVEIEELGRLHVAKEAVLDEQAHHAGRPLRL